MKIAAQKTFTPDLVSSLNQALKNSLTGINQYFLHARMLKHMGFLRLADHAYKESLGTMKYTDHLVNHILLLGGAPNLQELGALRIGQAAYDMLKNDLLLVREKQADLKEALMQAKKASHSASLATLEAMLASEAEHERFIEAELKSIDTLGLNAYLQGQS